MSHGPDARGVQEASIRAALAADRTIDISTMGRKTGQPRRIEMAFHRLDGAIYLTGTPGKRDWYANLLAHPDFTFHLKRSVTADLPAQATPITDPAARRAILACILERDRPERPWAPTSGAGSTGGRGRGRCSIASSRRSWRPTLSTPGRGRGTASAAFRRRSGAPSTPSCANWRTPAGEARRFT
jgi:deazaflavin-dependent oxidoreductase (nitroreductase family)